MAKKKYKNEGIMKLLTILGAILGILGAVSFFASLAGSPFLPSPFTPANANAIVYGILLLIISILTFLCAYRPDDPLPFNWVVLLIMAILLFVFGSLWGGLCVIVAAIIGLVEDL